MPGRLRPWILVFGLWLALAAPAQANPFSGGRDTAATDGSPVEISQVPGPIAAIGRALITFQRESSKLIARHMKAIRDGRTSAPLLIGLGLAFLYGVVHALGPGHGKLVVVSYFLARDARIGRGLLMGVQIAIFHVISALVAVALADLLLRRAFGGPPAEIPGVRLASYGLIALIGGWMLAQAVRRSRARRAGQAVDAQACCVHDHGRDQGRGHGQQGALSLGVGLVPCTGAVLILLYAMANDILWAGMLLVIAIAAGMAITMGGLGLLSVLARRTVATRLERQGGGARLSVISDYAGALMITAIGVALFWAAWPA